ncbi:MAG: IS110 family transposase, partial [Bradyrhizobium sp.]|nr:IS110 family transposase [Bradyrhizobium sp.]
RVERLEAAINEFLPTWSLEPMVRALQALRGVDLIVAVTFATEIGDVRRFENPRQLMGYLGLTPSERSTGDTVRRGGITKAGNGHARRLLTEAAWSYRFKPRIGYQAQKRQEDLHESQRSIAWKAQMRLCDRFAKLHARGLAINKVCVAVARELAGFVWALAQACQADHAIKATP